MKKKKGHDIKLGSDCCTVYFDNYNRIWYSGAVVTYNGINQPLPYTRETKEEAEELVKRLMKSNEDAIRTH